MKPLNLVYHEFFLHPISTPRSFVCCVPLPHRLIASSLDCHRICVLCCSRQSRAVLQLFDPFVGGADRVRRRRRVAAVPGAGRSGRVSGGALVRSRHGSDRARRSVDPGPGLCARLLRRHGAGRHRLAQRQEAAQSHHYGTHGRAVCGTCLALALALGCSAARLLQWRFARSRVRLRSCSLISYVDNQLTQASRAAATATPTGAAATAGSAGRSGAEAHLLRVVGSTCTPLQPRYPLPSLCLVCV
jgi:hypothetical protein